MDTSKIKKQVTRTPATEPAQAENSVEEPVEVSEESSVEDDADSEPATPAAPQETEDVFEKVAGEGGAKVLTKSPSIAENAKPELAKQVKTGLTSSQLGPLPKAQELEKEPEKKATKKG